MKRLMRETASDLCYLLTCLVCLIALGIDRFVKDTSPREQGFFLGMLFCCTVVFTLAILSEPL